MRLNYSIEASVNTLSSFLSVNRPCDEVFNWLSQALSRNGLRVLRTFDLYNVRIGHEDCPSPQHGTEQCDCQMMIVLIYGNIAEPTTLILHGNNEQTWLSLINNSLQHTDPSVQSAIEQALQTNSPR